MDYGLLIVHQHHYSTYIYIFTLTFCDKVTENAQDIIDI